MHGRDDRADAEAELEAERDVEQDADQRQHRRPDALASSAPAPTAGPDDLGADDAEVAEVGLLQARCRSARAIALSDAPDFGADLRHANHDLVLRRIAVGLHDDVLAAGKVCLQRVAHLLDR